MTLEQSARWRGWVAVVGAVIILAVAISIEAGYKSADLAILGGLCGWVAIFAARGWWKRRRQIQRLDYQARSIAKATSQG